MDSKMDDAYDKKVNRKRCTINLAALDTSSTKKPLLEYRSQETIVDLNDDCLLAIFKNLSKIDLCHVQNTCTRFVPLAESAFRYSLISKPNWIQFQMAESVSNTRRISYKFGHLFRSIHIWQKIDSDILERLTQITSLTLVHVKIDCNIIRIIHSAEHLEALNMYYCKFNDDGDTKGHSSKSLRDKISPLLRVTCQAQLPPLPIFSEFLQYNPQLKRLGLPIGITENYIAHILRYVPQLSELVLFTNRYTHRTTHLIQLISNLKNLRLLTINGRASRVSATPVLRDITRTTSAITHLKLNDFVIDHNNMKIMSEMKNLQHLALTGRFVSLSSNLVSLVASLPLLNNFTVSFTSCYAYYLIGQCNVNFNALKDIVKAGKELTCLKLLYVRDIRIDENSYAELLDILKEGNRKERLSITIEGCKYSTSADLPMHVRKTTLKIDYATVPCDCN